MKKLADPSRRSLLLSTAALGALGVPRSSRAASSAPDNLVVLFADGGWDTTFSVDPKPIDSGVEGPWVDNVGRNPNDREYQATIRGIPLQLNDHKRPAVTSFFETWGSRACVVNGIWTGSIVHQPARIRMLTGTTRATSPDFATIVGVERGARDDLPLASVDFTGRGYTGPFAAKTGRIGHSAQLKALLDPATTFRAPPGSGLEYPLFAPTVEEEAAIRDHLEARIRQVKRQVGRHPRNRQLLADMVEAYDRRQRLMEGAQVLTEPLKLGTKPSLDSQAELAVSLLESRLCHTVLIGEDGPLWDTHDANHLQHDRYQLFYRAANILLEGLRVSGLLERTLVVLLSEMTRTPRRNWKTGKDHWSHTSIVLVGAGVSGGRVVGQSNDFLESQPVDLQTGAARPDGRLAKYDNVVAGILMHMGIDPESYLPGVPPFTAASQ